MKRNIIPSHTTQEIIEDVNMTSGVIEVGEGATVRYTARANNLERKFVIHKNARVEYRSHLDGATIQTETVRAELTGECAEFHLQSTFLGEANDQLEMHHTVVHQAPRTVSELVTKGALGGTATGMYRSMIEMTKHAAQSVGAQKESTLLFSKTARMDAVPDLAIATNDVRCSHAVATTRVNPEQLFYLMARGLSEPEAVRVIVGGHLGVV